MFPLEMYSFWGKAYRSLKVCIHLTLPEAHQMSTETYQHSEEGWLRKTLGILINLFYF